ncbi:MAG TPA: hypothetical protein VFE54_07095 [Mucilaginibacter sp.]|nr:hypothetical protein [Mucilaginibacter sp.]
MVLLGSVTDKGSIYYAYKFKQVGRDTNATYIGIAGPFKPGSSALNFKRYNAYTDYDTKKTNWMKQAKAMIPELREAFALDKKEDHSKEIK